MAKPVSVLYVSTEVSPFAKTGSLADVANALPMSLFNIGTEIRVVMPKYGFISERRSRLHEVIRLKDINVTLNGTERKINVRVGVLPDTRVQVYFIDNEEFFKRDSLYTNPKTQSDYEDNHVRFAFFAKSIFEMLKRLGWQPTIIHCNDWHTGLIPYYLKQYYRQDEFFSSMKTLFTVHTTAYQGIFGSQGASEIDIAPDHVNEDVILQNGSLNFLKCGITQADFVSTISERYARDTAETPEVSNGLHPYFKKLSSHYTGISNGLDYKLWDPEKDKLIPANYSADHLSGKLECKKAIVEKLGLPFSESTPVVGIVTRMVDNKSIDLMIDAIPDLLTKDIQLVFMGQGEEKYQKVLESLKNRYPGRMGVTFTHDHQVSHMIFAGADIYLMPSKFENSAASHLSSLRYGTIPVVFPTGNLDDCIIDLKQSSIKTATGFKMTALTRENLIETVSLALETYGNRDKWNHLVRNAMAADFSWEKTAADYLALYKKLLKEK